MNYRQYSYRNMEAATIIKQLLTRESTSIITYDYLMVIAETEESKQLLSEVIQIRRKNDERLKWLFFQLSGQMVTVNQETFEKPDTYKDGISIKVKRQQRRLDLLKELFMWITEVPYRTVVDNIIVEEEWVLEVLIYLER
ncbi:hypothetical protein [Alkalihalobacillus sp. BA299]|uniref:hypothetical protein n=1 Tax=Alkalihalobacillus sp. BA299 TaxID=2815938 RepID=UPI001ADD5478|nr:hypothetical protein [Alkalihalobacillus sp. BA299]